MLLSAIIYVILTALAAHRVWTIWQRKGPWRRLILWIAAAIAVYFGLLALVAGPGAKVLDNLSGEAFEAAVAALALPVVLGLCELGFRAIDGPFPAVAPVNVDRRKLYPWMAAAAAVVLAMAAALRVVPESWHDNLMIATFVAALGSTVALWFLHYKARRFDYGRAALQSQFWVHWRYAAGELQAWKGLDPHAAPETWMGPEGLLFVGDYAPWTLSVYQLVRADTTVESPPRLNFTFRKRSFGDAVSEDVMHVAIPKDGAGDLAMIERELRARCPQAQVRLT
jgi:hypothetical protein